MSIAGGLRTDLIRLFADFGETTDSGLTAPGSPRSPLTVERVVPGAYDPSTGATGAPTTITQTGVGRLGSYSDYATDGTIIKQNDRRVTFVGDDPTFEPQINDRLLNGVDVYTIMNLKPREVGGQWVCWTMQVRR